MQFAQHSLILDDHKLYIFSPTIFASFVDDLFLKVSAYFHKYQENSKVRKSMIPKNLNESQSLFPETVKLSSKLFQEPINSILMEDDAIAIYINTSSNRLSYSLFNLAF